MAVERCHFATHLVDVLDRVLEKGVVIDDDRARESRVGIDLLAAGRRLVASLDPLEPDGPAPSPGARRSAHRR